MFAEFVIAHQRAERRAAEHAVFFLVDLFKEGALVEFGGALQVLEQLLLGAVHDLDLELSTGFALIHQVLETAPGAFQFLESGVVHDLVQLQGNQVIDLRDAGVDHHLRVARDGHGAIDELADEFLDQVAPALFRSGLDAKAAFFDDLIEKAFLDGLFLRGRCGSGGLRSLCVSHWIPP